jgi:predicted nucleotidyltransferase
MRKYLDAGNQDRLWREETDLMGKNFDYERAGSRLLGRDMAKILNPGIKKTVKRYWRRRPGRRADIGLFIA